MLREWLVMRVDWMFCPGENIIREKTRETVFTNKSSGGAINLSTLGRESRPLKNQKQSQPSNPPLTQSPTPPPPQSSMALPNKQVPAPPPPPKHQPPKAAGLAASSNLPPFHKSESGGSSTALGSTIAGTREWSGKSEVVALG
ncbi:hypothetical protein OIU79_003859 [Salix purpurea]|uniref:Uncharacterized protein n=1 Tax=Salix purpurea TaxID=77065 RepID=A0A9Q0Z8X1_SALPP|nr:hypothetical protein OIU79_003859 [Salix purpurea]